MMRHRGPRMKYIREGNDQHQQMPEISRKLNLRNNQKGVIAYFREALNSMVGIQNVAFR